MPVVGIVPTKELVDYLTMIARELVQTGKEYMEVSSLTLLDGSEHWFTEIEFTPALMESHINNLLAKKKDLLPQVDYTDCKACVIGEAKKLGMKYSENYIRDSFFLSLEKRGQMTEATVQPPALSVRDSVADYEQLGPGHFRRKEEK